MDSIKDQTRRLYRMCFQDEADYEEAYFTYVYDSRRNCVLKRGGQVVCALQVVPVSVRLSIQAEEGVLSGYISGACTHPNFRGKGLMRELMKRTLRKMWRKGTHFATLIPANEGLFGFYAASGFARAFDYSKETWWYSRTHFPSVPVIKGTVEADNPIRWSFEPQEVSVEKLTCMILEKPDYPYFTPYLHVRNKFQGYHYYFGNFEKLVEKDMELEGAQCWIVLSPDQKLTAFSICYPKENRVRIASLTSDTPAIEAQLLRSMAMHYQASEILLYSEPKEQATNFPQGMARVVHVLNLLDRYAAQHPHVQATFTLNDPLIPENKGTYSLSGNGKVMRSGEKAPVISVADLTQALLGYYPEKLPPVLRSFPKSQPFMQMMVI